MGHENPRILSPQISNHPAIRQIEPHSTWETFTTPQLAEITLYLISKIEGELDEDDDLEILMAVASELYRRRQPKEVACADHQSN
jgi:hypothetical protein